MDDGDQKFRVRTSAGPKFFDATNGYVLPHEHVLVDLRGYWEGTGRWDELDDSDAALTLETQHAHRRLPQGTTRENLVLADWYVAAKELRRAKENGCQLIVDLTTFGLDPQPVLAVKSCDLAGLPVVLPVGRYLGHALSTEHSDLSVSALTDHWVEQIDTGLDGLSYGIIGEIGTSAEISPVEEISVRAAARVQARTGLPLNIHVDPFGRQGHNVLDLLEQEGAALTKVALSHCDGDIDVDWLATLASRGCYVEFDLFGTDHEWTILGRGFNSDVERINALTRLVELEFLDHLLISHDICMKSALKRYGGWGYGHLGDEILPALDEQIGMDARIQISATNPLRHLSTDY